MDGSGPPGPGGWLVRRFGDAGKAAYAFVSCALALTVSGLAAYLMKQPLLFPSLGPTAFLFFESPMSAASSPRNTLIGHLTAVLAGSASLALFGLLNEPGVLQEGVTLSRVWAASLSLSLTGAVLLILKSSLSSGGCDDAHSKPGASENTA